MSKLRFEFETGRNRFAKVVEISEFVIGGWTGRDREAVEAHIRELETLGIPRPASTPIFYRVADDNLTNSEVIQVVGTGSTGEVECVLVQLDDGLWVGVGSDHTDRELEKHSVSLSKQVCAKPVSRTLWSFDEIKDDWDRLQLCSYATIDGERRLYQQGQAGEMLPPLELIEQYRVGGLDAGTVMYCGTLPVIGGFEFAQRFELKLQNPATGKILEHSYQIVPLPVAG